MHRTLHLAKPLPLPRCPASVPNGARARPEMRSPMVTRRQREILDLLARCHAVDFHPSPAHLSRLVGIGGEKAIRSELGRLIMEGEVNGVEAGSGNTPARYRLKGCSCPWCKPSPTLVAEP